jgi:hypothetical protein
METQGSCAIWAMKPETPRAAANKSTAWLVRASPRSGARDGSSDRKRVSKQIDSWT